MDITNCDPNAARSSMVDGGVKENTIKAFAKGGSLKCCDDKDSFKVVQRVRVAL